jgi:alkaline phosphatase
LKQIDFANGGKYVVSQRTKDQPGPDVLSKSANLAVVEDARLLGYFGHTGGHLPYQTADGKYNPTRGIRDADRYTPDEILENPTLADMTQAALTVLSQNDKGFWLMIEAGDVDWANHNNNIDDSIGAVFSGEAAFEVVTRWIEKNSNWDESAVIVTADHGHFLVVSDPAALTGKHRQPETKTADANDDH